ncbi:hypothetical protein BLFGPEAP_02794 [Candidatus Methanoperedenaceae archaeon GB50]|nr:hypothetical protein BLFGPEAP_02794 [Candidatus Methanoperedenaceae archaeon GB50]
MVESYFTNNIFRIRYKFLLSKTLEFFNQTAQFEFNLYFIHFISIPLKFYILLILSFFLGSIFGMFYTFKGMA